MPRFPTKNELIVALRWCLGVCMVDFQQSLCQFTPVYPACNMRTSKRIWCMLMILKKNKCHTVRFACDDSSVVLVSEEVWHLFPHVNLFVRVILVFISFMAYPWLGPCLPFYSVVKPSD